MGTFIALGNLPRSFTSGGPMEIQQLRYFVLSARRGSFKAAADELFVSRVALSKAVAKLECEIGVPLFDRSRSGVCLTPAGQHFLEKAAPVVVGFDDLEKTIGAERNTLVISLGIPVSWTEAFMPAIDRFTSEHPNIRVNASSWADIECVRKVGAGELDVVISHLPITGTADEGKVLVHTPLYIAMSADCPLAAKDVVTKDDLADYSIIYYACGYTDLVWAPRIGGASEECANDMLHIYARVHRGEAVFPTPLETVPSYDAGIVCRRYSGGLDDVVMTCYVATEVKANAQLAKACFELRDALVLSSP